MYGVETMKKYRKYIVAFILLSILAVAIGYGMTKMNSTSNATVIEKLPSTDIIKTYNTIKASYSDLARTPDTYKGKKINIKGTVIQVGESGNKVGLRVELGNDPDKVMFVTYTTDKDYKRVLENDTVTILGVSQGLYTYKSTFNADITIPSISADYIVIGN